MGGKKVGIIVALLLFLIIAVFLIITLFTILNDTQKQEQPEQNAIEKAAQEAEKPEERPQEALPTQEPSNIDQEESGSDEPEDPQPTQEQLLPPKDPPTISWMATSVGDSGTRDEFIKKIIVDNQDHVFVAGTTKSSLNLGRGTNGNQGNIDIFAVEYTKDGEVQTVYEANAPSASEDDIVEDIFVYNNSLYLAGSTKSNLDFGYDEDLENQGGFDFFIVTFDTKGRATNLIDSKHDSGEEDDFARELFVDDTGIYMIGETESSLSFGNKQHLKNEGGLDFFIGAFDHDGTARALLTYDQHEDDNDMLVDSYIDNQGNVYFAGSTKGDINFGNGVTLTNDGGSDFFIVKYNGSGTPLWAKSSHQRSGAKDDTAVALVGDDSGVYLAGISESDLHFGSNIRTTNSGKEDIFIVKYNHQGETQWVISPKGAGDDTLVDLVVDGSLLYMTGITEGPITFEETTLENDGKFDMFLAKYRNDALEWATKPTFGVENDIPVKIVLENQHIYLGANTRSNLNFGNDIILDNQGKTDFFIVKYTPSGMPRYLLTTQENKRSTSDSDRVRVDVDNSGAGNDELVDFIVQDEHLYIIGNTDGNLGFGNEYVVSNDGESDFFVAKYTE